MVQQLNAERIKLATVRSTWWSALITVVSSAAIALIIALNLRGGDTDSSAETLTGLFFFAAQIAQIAIMCMAIMVTASEYKFGVIRLTFQANPHRWVVLIAKALVILVFSFVVGMLTALACIGIAKPLLKDGVPLNLGDDQVGRMLLGLGLYFAVSALMAASVGALLRNSSVAIPIVIVWSLIVEKVLVGIEATRGFGEHLPFFAGALITQQRDDEFMAPLSGFGLFCLYTLAVFLIAVIVTENRDA